MLGHLSTVHGGALPDSRGVRGPTLARHRLSKPKGRAESLLYRLESLHQQPEQADDWRPRDAWSRILQSQSRDDNTRGFDLPNGARHHGIRYPLSLDKGG